MKFHVQTFGCQMNFYDSDTLLGILKSSGHEPIDDIQSADMAVLYTCAIRDGAVQRIYGQLGHLKSLKRNGTIKYVGVAGCMAQHEAEILAEKCDFVDWIMGPSSLPALPDVMARVESGESPVFALNVIDGEDREDFESLEKPISYPCFISVMKGCDKACTYCVVPSTRGPERSRPVDSILDEIRQLVDKGYAEVTLLGQTVNSYRFGKYEFPDLLEKIDGISGLKRIRFTTSHPADADDRLFEAMRDLPKVVEHLNLPVQHGSTRILEAMNRTYTRDEYIDIIHSFRSIVPAPDSSLTTDLIVGFPGETDEDFEELISLMEQIRYDGCFMFKFSKRRGTPAATMAEQVPDEVSSARLKRVIETNQRIATEINNSLVGRKLEVMLEKPTTDQRSGADWDARTRTNKGVKVYAAPHDAQAGDVIHVHVDRATTYTLFGHAVAGASEAAA